MPLRLVAVDMDGTFLDSNQSYDRETFAGLYQQLRERGITFAVASGNQLAQLRSYFPGYPEVLFAAENGGVIADQDTILHATQFSGEQVGEILEQIALRPELQTLVCCVEHAYVLASAPQRFRDLAAKYYTQLAVVESFTGIEEPVVKFALDCPEETTAEMLDWLHGRVSHIATPTSSGHGSIDLIVPGAHKGAALRWISERLGIPTEQMLVFGDGGNDVEMLRVAGRGVVMGNAPDAIKEVGDEVIGTNDEQAVLAYLANVLASDSEFP